MKVITTLGLVAAVAALGGCGAQNRTSIEIVKPLRYTLKAGSSSSPPSCTQDTTVGDEDGVMDVGYGANTFFEPFDILNQMTDNTDLTNANRVNSADFEGQSVVVTYLGTNDATTTALSGLSAQIPVSIPVSAGGGTNDAVIPLIPANVGKAIGAAVASASGDQQTVLVRFRIDGVRKDGMAVSTGDFQFPVVVCNGCLACPNPVFCTDPSLPGQNPILCP